MSTSCTKICTFNIGNRADGNLFEELYDVKLKEFLLVRWLNQNLLVFSNNQHFK